MKSIENIPAHILKPEVCYRRAKIFGGALTRPFGVRLDTVTTQRWVEVTSLFRLIDNYIDGSPDQLDERVERVQQELDNPSSLEEYYPSLLPEALGNPGFSRVQWFGKQIIALNRYIKSADTEERYIRLRQYEGRQTARLLVELTSDDMKEHTGFARFEVGMDMVGETLNLADSFIDIRGDQKRGELGFVPSPSFRARLLGRSAARFTHYAPKILRPTNDVIETV